MGGAVRIPLHFPEHGVGISQAECERLTAHKGGLCCRVEPGLPDKRRTPKLEGVICIKFKSSRGVWNSNEIFGKEIRGGFVKPPVRQGNARIERLKFPLQVQQKSPMPGQEAGIEMSFRTSIRRVNIAEIGKSPQAFHEAG